MIERIDLSSCRTKLAKRSFDQVGSPTPADSFLQPNVLEITLRKLNLGLLIHPNPTYTF